MNTWNAGGYSMADIQRLRDEAWSQRDELMSFGSSVPIWVGPTEPVSAADGDVWMDTSEMQIPDPTQDTSRWTVRGNLLPPGLSLNTTTGVITGVPTGVSDTTVTVSRWLPGDPPEPQQPTGRFQNLDFP